MNEEVLSVRISGSPVGLMTQTSNREMRFEYLDTAKKAISLSMPLGNDLPYGNLVCETYFGGLLPESLEARKAIGREFDANPNSTFSMLAAIGHDCAGAISFHAVDAPIELDHYHELQVKKLSAKQLEKHIIELPQKPLFLGIADLRSSLAGVQEKAAVCLIDNQVCLALNGTPTTHILKPAIRNYPATVQNEFLCLRVAKLLGLSVPNAEMRQAGAHDYLLVERYDRKVDAQKRIRRLHQEDFCQALGNKEKYERYYGPSLADCFELTYDLAIPVIARNEMMQVVVFNYLIGNTDAHAKNFAVLYDEKWKIRLAPFYDLLCNQIYENLTADMSMKIGKNFEHGKITIDDWQEMCKSVGFSFPELKKIIGKQTEVLPKIFLDEREELAGSEFDSPILDSLVDQINKNCRKLRKTV